MIELPLLNESTNASPDAGKGSFGALATSRGHLPLKAMSVEGRIDGLLSQVTLSQSFVNATDVPLEATYIFPLPDRAAVTGFVMEVGGRTIEGILEERGKARAAYEEARQEGRRASIAEEERPDVFTLRVGNLMPNEEAVIRFTMAGILPYQDGEVTFRFPLVVATRYVPGLPLPGPAVGDGVAADTDAAPDASRISPPVLLPGFPNPVRLSLSIELHGWGVAHGLRSSLHAVATEESDDVCRIRLLPGEKLDRDFVLRYKLGGETVSSSLTFHPDSPNGGTFALTVIPPDLSPVEPPRPRDVVFVLDRSGSMEGWKIVAARRAMMRMVDALVPTDRFGVLAFSGSIKTLDRDEGETICLIAASDRNRFRATEFLTKLDASGGTEMAPALKYAAHSLRADASKRDRILILVTDGQVANEDQILQHLGTQLDGVRVFTLGIDTAVNAGFLKRLAECGGGGGSCELVESENRLDEVMETIRRRIGSPILTDLAIAGKAMKIEPDSLVPGGGTHLFPGVPAVILGRYRGRTPRSVTLTARDRAGKAWKQEAPATVRTNPAVVAAWARGRLRALEDRYATGREDRRSLERAILETSLRHGVLCRFTAYVSVDRSQVVNEGGEVLKVTQPVYRSNPDLNDETRLAQPRRSGGGYGGAPCYDAFPSRSRACVMPSSLEAPTLLDKIIGKITGRANEVPPAQAAPPGKSGFDSAVGDDSRFVVASSMASGPPSGEGGANLPPPLVDRFDSVTPIGRGGMGERYEAFDRSRGFKVEIRSISRTADRASEEARTRRLADLARLEHPGILSILEVVALGDRLLLVSRYLDWPTLDHLLTQFGSPTPQRAAEILAALADLVQFCHSRGIIHGNLTPSEILLAEGPSVTLAGFLPAHIPEGEIIGTPAYMAPEGWGPDIAAKARAEVYALGVILYRMLTGELPYAGSSAVETMKRAAAGGALPPRGIKPEISPDLERVCLCAIATDPAGRYPTARDLADDLRKVLSPDLREGARGLHASRAPGTGDRRNSRGPDRREGFWKGASD